MTEAKCIDCKYDKAESYHDKMWCRGCRQKDRFKTKEVMVEEDKLLNIIEMNDSLVEFSEGGIEHCILPEHYGQMANEIQKHIDKLKNDL